MSSVLLCVAAVGFALGIFTRSCIEFGVIEVVWVISVSFVLSLLWRRKSEAFSAPFLLGLCIFLLFSSFGALRMEIASWSEMSPIFEQKLNTPVTFEGEVVREPDVRSRTQQLYVKVGDELILVTTNPYTKVQYGDSILIKGILEKPESFETDLGRTFNYVGYLQARGVSYMIPFAELTVLSSDNGNVIISKLFDFKQTFLASMRAAILEPQAGLAAGLLLGVKQALDADLEEAFRKAGITHIVVLSGYNIMLVVAFVMYMLALVLPFHARLLVGIVAIVLFACLVGLSATVVRASIMAVLILIAKITGRTYAVVRALIFAAVLMLLINPYLLVHDVGFQFSFIATLGLIVVAPYLEKYVGFMPTRLGLREFLTATLATQLFITPILLYQMGEFSVVAVIVNVLVLPMVPIAMLLTFLASMVSIVSVPIAIPFAYLAYVSLSYIMFIAERFAALPFASVSIPAFPFIFVVLSYIVFVAILWRLHTKEISSNDELSAWTFVDEDELKKKLKKIERSSPPLPTPIFFQ